MRLKQFSLQNQKMILQGLKILLPRSFVQHHLFVFEDDGHRLLAKQVLNICFA